MNSQGQSQRAYLAPWAQTMCSSADSSSVVKPLSSCRINVGLWTKAKQRRGCKLAKYWSTTRRRVRPLGRLGDTSLHPVSLLLLQTSNTDEMTHQDCPSGIATLGLLSCPLCDPSPPASEFAGVSSWRGGKRLSPARNEERSFSTLASRPSAAAASPWANDDEDDSPGRSRLRVQRGAAPPSYTQSTFLAAQRPHLGRSPSHLVLERRQALQERYVRIFFKATAEAEADRLMAAAAAAVPSSATHSSCRRSQLRQPLGRPSHLTCGEREGRRAVGLVACVDFSVGCVVFVWLSYLARATDSTAHDDLRDLAAKKKGKASTNITMQRGKSKRWVRG